MLIGTIDFYRCTTFTDLDFAWGSQGQCNAKHYCFIFLLIFNWSGWNLIWCWSNSCWTFWYYVWVRLLEQRKELLFYWLRQKTNVGMHSDIYDLLCFTAGVMIDTAELYIWITVYLTLTLIQGHRSARKQELMQQLSHNVFSWFFNGIWFTV